MSKRRIPSIEQLRQRATMCALEREYGREAIVAALREEAAALRDQISASEPSRAARAPGPDEAPVMPVMIDAAEDAAAVIERNLPARLRRQFEPSLRPVINATGVIVHTNLGRAPLAEAAARRAAGLATGYVNLEYDLERGQRGARDVHAERLLCRLSGAEAAVVVNNNAAATLVILAALAAGREVVVSRGELVEIGGGFRIPDVMAQSGAVLREVGTTNKTRAADYAAAVSERTSLILRVHPSNFRMEGFVERPALDELVALGRQLDVPVAEDLGSGLVETDEDAKAAPGPLRDEPTIQASVRAGADLVCFSGDKLLGGPQAGIIVGRRDLLQRVRRHPLMRALRADKLTYAALEATLLEYASGRAEHTVPVRRMMAIPPAALESRARALVSRLHAPRLRAEPIPGESATGGGSAPGTALPTWLVALAMPGLSPDLLDARLRSLDPPVIARIERDRVVLDLRTILPEQDDLVLALLQRLDEQG